MLRRYEVKVESADNQKTTSGKISIIIQRICIAIFEKLPFSYLKSKVIPFKRC